MVNYHIINNYNTNESDQIFTNKINEKLYKIILLLETTNNLYE